MQVSVSDLRLKLSEYIRRAVAGEVFVVTNRGTPVARLVRAGATENGDRLAVREPRGAYDAGAEGRPLRVGVRALKAEMPRYLRSVRDGERVVITDRDTPAAELQPVPAAGRLPGVPQWLSSVEAAEVERALREDPPPSELLPLVEAGTLIWKGRFRYKDLPPPYRPPDDYDGPTLSEIVIAMRRE